MKVIKNANGTYTLIHNDGHEEACKVIKCHDREFVRLPDGLNKKHISVKTFDDIDEVELESITTHLVGSKTNDVKTPKTSTTSKAPKLNELVELLTDDERKIYKELMDKAAKRFERKKKFDELESAKAEVARLEAELNNEVEG